MKKQASAPVAWSDFRKWMSNVLPLAACVPFPIAGYYFDSQGKALISIICYAATLPALWLGINFLALFQNSQLKTALRRKLEAVHPEQMGKAVFAGFSRPNAASGIHLHEDVGWVMMDDDAIRFLGERSQYDLSKQMVKNVRFGANWNTLLGLGRWVIVEGTESGKRIQMRFEPRERPTMLANLFYGKTLLNRIREWAKKP